MTGFANTLELPYYAVVFSSALKDGTEGYEEMADLMVELASKQEGFLGIESARSEIGITVSYWRNLDSIRKWKSVTDHQIAQNRGRSEWYKSFKVRIAKVEREYGFESNI